MNSTFDYAVEQKRILDKKIVKIFNVLRGEPSKNMSRLLKYMEEVNSIFKPFTPCKKSCSNCCFIDVAVSNAEIYLIEKYINKKS